MKIFTVVGARPQFIKCAPVSAALRRNHEEFLVHTGQHYDDNMSRVFFDEMEIPRPDVNLEIGSASHAVQTAAMMTGLEPLMVEHSPDAVLIYGDTNSTLAGALVASKLHIPVAHVEAGLRSFNWEMPEEINRVVADRLSALLCCPTATAVNNLAKEGITHGVVNTGDVMYDALIHFKRLSKDSDVLDRFDLRPESYVLLTIHRPSNTDDPDNLRGILSGVQEGGETCIFPVHPRTRDVMATHNMTPGQFPKINFVPPIGYLDFLAAAAQAKAIVTDSGGVQKEAYWHGVPCITVRTETEWAETVEAGWNCLAGTDAAKLAKAIASFSPTGNRPHFYGDGHASTKIVEAVLRVH